MRADYAPRHDAGSRRMLGSSGPTSAANQRRVASFEAGEPQLVPVADMPFAEFPDLAAVPFLVAPDMYYTNQAEYDESAWLVRVYPDGSIEVGQTRAQMRRQADLVARGYVVGRVDENGDYVPHGLDLATGEWCDITHGDAAVRPGVGFQFK
jgi:hypothetical protein